MADGEQARARDRAVILDDLRADLAFVGSGGIAPYGLTGFHLTDFHLDEAATERGVLADASHRCVPADSGRFGRTAAHRAYEPDGFHPLITDTPFPAELHTALGRAGSDVITA
ncbi:hypothetical protein [Streptomyces sp. NBC_01635]|uniref:hypothetical protein n=1 Tax=Streptomyces sp. NBC_01635 TaxID=2975904 RepID=UPI0038631D78